MLVSDCEHSRPLNQKTFKHTAIPGIIGLNYYIVKMEGICIVKLEDTRVSQ